MNYHPLYSQLTQLAEEHTDNTAKMAILFVRERLQAGCDQENETESLSMYLSMQYLDILKNGLC